MELCGMSLALVILLIVLTMLLIGGLVVLLKLGVVGHYLFKDEPVAEGDYGLEQSHEAGQE